MTSCTTEKVAGADGSSSSCGSAIVTAGVVCPPFLAWPNAAGGGACSCWRWCLRRGGVLLGDAGPLRRLRVELAGEPGGAPLERAVRRVEATTVAVFCLDSGSRSCRRALRRASLAVESFRVSASALLFACCASALRAAFCFCQPKADSCCFVSQSADGAAAGGSSTFTCTAATTRASLPALATAFSSRVSSFPYLCGRRCVCEREALLRA